VPRTPDLFRGALLHGAERLKPLLVSTLFFMPPALGQSKAPPKPKGGPYVISVRAPAIEAAQGFLYWIMKHPSAVPWYRERPLAAVAPDRQEPVAPGLSGPKSGTQRSMTLPLRLPSMDLYAPSGTSVYYSTSAAKNAHLLRALPAGARGAEAQRTPVPRPTLKEALSMFPELKPYVPELLASKGYTVFALSLVGARSEALSAQLRFSERQSKVQDAALQEFERRARQARVRVVRVELELPADR
jgi:hypothetical protein